MFQLRQLKTFLAAAETLSFTKAAQKVHLSQSSVTEQIQTLEASIGRPLFIRSNNRLSLTPTGRGLVERARGLLAVAEEAFDAVRDNVDVPAGTIRVAAPQTLCSSLLLPLLAVHARQYPTTRVVVQERNSAATARAVLDGAADLGVVHGWPGGDDHELQIELIARDRALVVLPPGHALCGATDVTPASLAAYPLIVTAPGCRYRTYIEALLQHAPVRPFLRGEADSVPSLLQMVGAGLGVAVLPGRAVERSAAGSLEVRPLSGAEGLPICLLVRRHQVARPQVAAVAAAVRLAAAGSDEPVAAVDVQHRAGGVAVAKKEDDGVGDVLRRSNPAHRQPFGHRGQ
jgi:DNA-binding transcriptional LysR family regulator